MSVIPGSLDFTVLDADEALDDAMLTVDSRAQDLNIRSGVAAVVVDRSVDDDEPARCCARTMAPYKLPTRWVLRSDPNRGGAGT